MENVIITGATSMVGIALIKECIKHNTKVTAVIRPNSMKAHRLPQNSLIQTIECDLDDLNKLPQMVNHNFDCFYHLAWDGTSRALREDVFIHEENIHNTLTAVKAASDLGCTAFVGAGTQAEYGRISDTISPETPANPEYAYGIAKLSACRLSKQYCKQLGIRHVWARIFSIYGEYDMPDTMIMYAINTLLQGKKPSFTRCEQIWDYLYVDDAGNALYLLGEKGEGIYCIGSGKARPLKEYIEIIRDNIDEHLELGFGEKEYAKNQVMYLCADINTLTRDTGFVPLSSFETGIQKLISWYKGEYLK